MSERDMIMKNQLEDQEFARWLAIDEAFDEAYYLIGNPDIAQSGMDARLHYLRTGWLEGRNPNSWFDTQYYLRLHGDVAAAQMNPLLHYVWQGRREGRATKRPHHGLRTIIENACPSFHRAVHFPPSAPTPPSDIQRLLDEIIEPSSAGLIVSFGHDDYAENMGGVQRLTGEEAADFASSGWQYLHLSPGRPLPMLSDERNLDNYVFALRLDGRSLGPASAAQILLLLSAVAHKGREIDFVIHHLMGHAPEIVSTICGSVAGAQTYFWLHDFYTLCSSYSLLRNNWKYCHAPDRESLGCRVCAYGEERLVHVERIAHLFERLSPAILAPSETPLRIWSERSHLPHGEVHVVPIGKLVMAPAPVAPHVNGVVRIAFTGYEAHAKGWTMFQELLDRFATDNRFEFIRLGVDADTPTGDSRYRHIRVHADRDDRDAMVRALAEHQIDAVLLWPAWPETFSYVAHEVLAAGAFLITHSEAGNVPSVIATYAPQQGVVLNGADELFELFAVGGRLTAILAQPRQEGVVIPYQNAAHISLKRHAFMRDQRQRLQMEAVDA